MLRSIDWLVMTFREDRLSRNVGYLLLIYVARRKPEITRNDYSLTKTELTKFVMGTECVFCETGTEVLYVIQTNIVLQRANRWLACSTACNYDISVYVHNQPQQHCSCGFTMKPKGIQSIVDRNLNSKFPRDEMHLFKHYKQTRNITSL
jgi:hypothetical protein